jgi:flagellar hook assembly protein FlgD
LPGTTIEFDLPTAQFLSMMIIDVRGRIVRKLIDNEERFGYQSIVWDGKNDDGDVVSSGVYFYQIRTSSFTEAGKLVFLR